ncbi:MAG: PilT/PilU family type 4a pilus ATPase [Polyangiaceae bacterium]
MSNSSPYANETFFQQLLGKAIGARSSDIHFKVGQPPGARVSGDMVYFRVEKIRAEDTEAIASLVVRDPELRGNLEALQEHDTSYAVPGLGRFRVNVYRQRGSLAIVMRVIPTEIPTFEQIKAPAVCKDLAEKNNGLVLCVGAAGNGKSTTLASMIGHMNRNRALHIVTIEDPVEYMHIDDKSSVSQREVGSDTASFSKALRAALRQDPDVILVGEIRDEETMDIALKAAETGHLVLSTLHTPDCARTVLRLLSLLPGDPNETRLRIAGAIQGIVAQRLVPRADGNGLELVAEVLIGSAAVKEAIRKPEHNPPLKSLMEKGVHPYGMQTFEMALHALFKDGVIDEYAMEEALN